MFTPSAPVGGYSGWRIFNRTSERQFDIFLRSPELKRDLEHFRRRLPTVATAQDFVNDRRLLSVALGAFGLESEVSKKAIIRRVLEQPTDDPGSFVNRLNDPRWSQFARAFGFKDGKPQASFADGIEEITSTYAQRSFEAAAGESDPEIRLALNFRREITSIAQGKNVDRAGWLQVLGQKPLRRVIESAFGLPASFASLDVDRQRSELENNAESLFGNRSPAIFKEPANVERALQRFFLKQSQSSAPATGRGAAALALLTGYGAAPSAGIVNARIAE